MSCTIIDKTGKRLDWKLRQGQTWSFTMEFTDETTSDPIDLTIYTEIHLQVRKRPGADVLMEAKLTDNDFVISGADDNVLELSGIEVLPDKGVYRYDVDFITSAGKKDQYFYGSIIIVDEITTQPL